MVVAQKAKMMLCTKAAAGRFRVMRALPLWRERRRPTSCPANDRSVTPRADAKKCLSLYRLVHSDVDVNVTYTESTTLPYGPPPIQFFNDNGYIENGAVKTPSGTGGGTGGGGSGE